MAVSGIHHEGIHTGIGERLSTCFIVGADGGSGAETVFAVPVVCGFIVFDDGADIGEAVKTGQLAVCINGGQFADFVLEHDLEHILQAGAFGSGHGGLGHDVRDLHIVAGEELDVPGSDDPD